MIHPHPTSLAILTRRFTATLLLLMAAFLVLAMALSLPSANPSAVHAQAQAQAQSFQAEEEPPQPPAAGTIVVDYPEQHSIFPPEITAPTFQWRDATATHWQIEVVFRDGTAPLHLESAGEPMKMGEIDPRCVSASNELPHFTPRQAAAHTWIPSQQEWETIQHHSVAQPAEVRIHGSLNGRTVSEGSVTISTSVDPVGAPIFYRDVPLIPSRSQKGVIKPLAQSDLPLLAWRLRYVGEPRSHLLLTGLHTCANCHSFSADGKTMGMDLDGPGNDKGLYMLTPVKPQMSVRNEDVISWSSLRDTSEAPSRIGFMSQVSPDGNSVITMLRGQKSELVNGYFVVNFPNYKFLQVFYPTRGILAWYDRASGVKQPLPGADDPRYVQTNPVWTPDGENIIFARAEARDPQTPGQKLPDHALAPEETQVRFDLYRIPFHHGQGGVAIPIAGASANGMSNSFPKVSPDGKWIVFVKSRNALLMRPDSQLYIVPVAGGTARPLECNTARMNSWHSFSPNGHWLVFSSKSRTPYTQMFLTHLDAEGHASPAILIDNATAANRAVNIPEFLNIPSGGLEQIDIPAAEEYRLLDEANAFTAKGQLAEAIDAFRKVLAMDPRSAQAHMNLAVALEWQGNLAEAARHRQKARELDSSASETESDYGIAFFNREQFRAAVEAKDCGNTIAYGEKILAVAPDDADALAAIKQCSATLPASVP